MGATSQRQYLEAKFPGQLIYNNDLYQAIQYFRPQTRNDSNDAAKLYAKLLESSQNNPLWKVAIKFDDKNTLTHLFWMAPSQIELWYRKFTAGLHASSPVESINAWIKNYIFNSNISLCELAKVIDKRQISEDKKHQFILWKAAIPFNQEVISEFEEYQLPTDQHLEDIPDARQITASCMISDVNKNQIMSMWTVAVENKLVEKHFVILLTNGSHYCSCLSLINKGIICRHYFQIMLRSPTAKFHLKLIPSRWYYRNKDASKEPFLVASKFESDTPPIIPQHSVPFLTVIHQISQNSITLHERLTDIQLYGKITGLTHKATIKALKKKDMRIISILEDYLKDEEQNENVGGNSKLDDDNELDGEKLDDELDDELDNDKENHENHSFILNNPNKQTKSKGRPKGTKRIKASHEKNSSSVISKQYKCSQCGSMGHNKRNCSRK
ncbi:unnamed protein product [Rhizophagus irregularis]|nr:unnamed protein product [Rhizophagus irregularis]